MTFYERENFCILCICSLTTARVLMEFLPSGQKLSVFWFPFSWTAIVWFFNVTLCKKLWSQIEHLCGFFSLWITSIWSFNWSFLVKLYSQIEHLCAFFPSWIATWFINVTFCVKLRSQIKHLCDFFPSWIALIWFINLSFCPKLWSQLLWTIGWC